MTTPKQHEPAPPAETGSRQGAPGATTAFVDTRRFKVMRALVGALNPLTRRFLASRFGTRANEFLLLLRFRGRTSGRWYQTPVGYVRDGDRIVVVTSRTYRWWRNVREGADVEVRAAGQWYAAHARLVPPSDPAFDELIAVQVAARGPAMLQGFGMPIDDDGRISEADRETAASDALIVEIRLGEQLPGPSQ